MHKIREIQSIQMIPERRIVYTAGKGRINVREVNGLQKVLLEMTAEWKHSGWAYIADCTQMSPVTPEEGLVLAEMTKVIANNGCKAIAFIDQSTIILKVQAKHNTKQSKTGVLEGHFSTREEALNWLERVAGI